MTIQCACGAYNIKDIYKYIDDAQVVHALSHCGRVEAAACDTKLDDAYALYREVFITSLSGCASQFNMMVNREKCVNGITENAHMLAEAAVSTWYGAEIAEKVADTLDERANA